MAEVTAIVFATLYMLALLVSAMVPDRRIWFLLVFTCGPVLAIVLWLHRGLFWHV